MAAPPPHTTSRRCIALHWQINMAESSLRSLHPKNPIIGTLPDCCATSLFRSFHTSLLTGASAIDVFDQANFEARAARRSTRAAI
jgi:hypothetical protein